MCECLCVGLCCDVVFLGFCCVILCGASIFANGCECLCVVLCSVLLFVCCVVVYLLVVLCSCCVTLIVVVHSQNLQHGSPEASPNQAQPKTTRHFKRYQSDPRQPENKKVAPGGSKWHQIVIRQPRPKSGSRRLEMGSSQHRNPNVVPEDSKTINPFFYSFHFDEQ